MLESTAPSTTFVKKPMRRIALEEHFVMKHPEHIDRWLSTASMIPPPIVEKILPPLTDATPE